VKNINLRIGILDYGLGNIQSICNAISILGSQPILINSNSDIQSINGLILPGVGSFKAGMDAILNNGLDLTIQSINSNKTPILGICLGMQLLFEYGTEFGSTRGLCLLEGYIDKVETSENNQRLPHIGWSKIMPTNVPFNDLFSNFSEEELKFYFTHSYSARNVNSDVLSATVMYGNTPLVAAVKKHHIYGTQFHPEKSGSNGLKLLSNFLLITHKNLL